MDYDLLSDAMKESKVKEDVKQLFLAHLFFINNNKKHSQQKKTVANDNAKGDIEVFPTSCHAALMLMNDFILLAIKGTAPVATQGTAFAQKQKGARTQATGTKGIIKNTLMTSNAITVVRTGIQQDDVLKKRKARQRRIWKT
jgi:hypothetical protein